MMYVGDLHYNSLDMYQYATRTTHKMEEADPAIDAGAVSFQEIDIPRNL